MDKVSSNTLAALLKPFGVCSAYLNPDVVGYKLGGMADKVVQFINGMEADDMKDKVNYEFLQLPLFSQKYFVMEKYLILEE